MCRQTLLVESVNSDMLQTEHALQNMVPQAKHHWFFVVLMERPGKAYSRAPRNRAGRHSQPRAAQLLNASSCIFAAKIPQPGFCCCSYTWTEFKNDPSTGQGIITRPGYWIVKNSWGTGWPSPAPKDPVDKVQAAFFAVSHCLFSPCANDEVACFANLTCLSAARVEMSVCRFCTNQIRHICMYTCM